MKHKKNLEHTDSTQPKVRSQIRQNKTNYFQKFLLFSFLFHIAITLIIAVAPNLQKHKTSEVEVTLIEQPTPASIVKTENIMDEKKAEQVVQTDEHQSNNELDKNAKYLSAKNNTVQKETVAKNIGQFKNVLTQKNRAAQTAQSETKKQIKKNISEKKSESQLFNTGFDVYSSLNKNKIVQKMAQKEHSFQNGSTLQQPQQASATQDHIENADPSLMTQLNTREYKYYGYNMRIRTQLDQWYETKLREQMKKIISQGRTIASEENKRTQLLIILNAKGNLVGVQVLGASGVRELDDAAVEAFKKAAPFPNPPKGMVDNDGTIKVRWDFVLS